MSISNTLRKASRLQEKIDHLREQLAGVLDKARAEIASIPKEVITGGVRGTGRPKMLKAALPKARTGRGRGRLHASPKTSQRAKAVATAKTARRSPLAGQKRSASPSGPLSPAVVKVLQSKSKPMNVRDILDGLFANGYKFNSAEPKKNLAARIYRLKGVKQVSAGLFGLV